MRPRAFPLTPTVRGRDTLLEFTVPPLAYGDSIDIDILFNFFLLSLSLFLSPSSSVFPPDLSQGFG